MPRFGIVDVVRGEAEESGLRSTTGRIKHGGVAAGVTSVRRRACTRPHRPMYSSSFGGFCRFSSRRRYGAGTGTDSLVRSFVD